MVLSHKQIGEVTERTGLSSRTTRYYEEVGLVVRSARSQRGSRLDDELSGTPRTEIRRQRRSASRQQ